MRRDRFVIGHLLGPRPLRIKGVTRRRPGPDHATGRRQALPMIEQRLWFLLSGDEKRPAPKSKLLFGLAKQPAQFDPLLTEQLRRLFTAHIGQKL